MLRKFQLIIILLLALQIIKSQDCTDFHLGFCAIPDFTYYYNQQSKSVPLNIGNTVQFSIIAYDHTDYYLSICKHRKFNTLGLKIFEDNSSKDLLYDNALNFYCDTIKFSNDATRKLIIELSLPKDKNPSDDNKSRCVGLMIATRMRE